MPSEAHLIARVQTLGMDFSFLLHDPDAELASPLSEEDISLLTDDGVEEHLREVGYAQEEDAVDQAPQGLRGT